MVCTIVFYLILKQRSKLTKIKDKVRLEKSEIKTQKAHSRTLRLQMEVRRIPTVGLATLEK